MKEIRYEEMGCGSVQEAVESSCEKEIKKGKDIPVTSHGGP
jgi:hypothetical protein